ncbi:BA14K family protein [Microvirga tunisiensis]|uniref:BA14K family protein n=2 Tax=Pannonibacter tanglangensis TaxID=2750084 RepID=A0ABW9ZFA0_9HYPH|nr:MULTISPECIES: BA14K family protein [unclassified Pannonibacter]NBN63348.1 BA14K family protein [Pannonibacter sp. XCT-34]NBN76983.1 BA14K family protein [Pannonibacter sp. XCT-53]
MTRFKRSAVALALTASMLVPVAGPALAGDGWGERGGRHGWSNDWDDDYRHRPYNPDRKRKSDNTDAAIAAGIIGLAAGAILFGAMSDSSTSAPPPPAYYPPAPAPVYGGGYGGQVYGSPVYGGGYGGVGRIPEPSVPVDDHPIIVHGGQVAGGQGVGYQPWSPAWYDYCRARYRSFNPQTGTYTTYAGEQRFCQ